MRSRKSSGYKTSERDGLGHFGQALAPFVLNVTAVCRVFLCASVRVWVEGLITRQQLSYYETRLKKNATRVFVPQKDTKPEFPPRLTKVRT